MLISSFTLIGVLCAIGSGAVAVVESRPHDTRAHRVNIPAVPRTGGKDGRGIDSSLAYTVDFLSENGTLFANNVPVFPATLPMKLDAVRHMHNGQHTVPLTYQSSVKSVPSGPDGMVGYRFLLELIFYDLHGEPVSDFIVTVLLNRGVGGSVVFSRPELEVIQK